MDTTTVLEIIKMLDTRLYGLTHQFLFADDEMLQEEYDARHAELINFRNHLQEFIEGQVNAAENQSAEQ